ncbi:hypothetical protein MTO96_021590 [Rhipicephalus appendiculatus]
MTPDWSSPRYITPPPARYPMALTTGPLRTGPLRKRGPATNCQPSRESQSAASEPQPQGRGHLDVPGLRGNPHGLCYLEANGAARRKEKPPSPPEPEEPWPKAASQTMLERAGRNTSPTGSSQSPPTT